MCVAKKLPDLFLFFQQQSTMVDLSIYVHIEEELGSLGFLLPQVLHERENFQYYIIISLEQ